MNSESLIDLAGITPRQLQWWCETQTVDCTLDAHSRLFSELQVLRCLVVADLVQKGVSVKRCRCWLGPLVCPTFPKDWLIVDPKGKGPVMMWVDTPQEIMEIFKLSAGGLLLVDVGRLRVRAKAASRH